MVPPLKVRVEHAEGMAGEKLETLEKEIAETMSKRLKISPRILWADPGSLERSPPLEVRRSGEHIDPDPAE